MTSAVAAADTEAPRGARTAVYALMAAEAISLVGTRISFIALPWLILITTHDPIKLGIISGSSALPYVLNGFIASPLVDRLGARRMSIVSDLASAVTMAVVAVAYNSNIAVLAVIVAIGGSFRGVGDRAKNTMLKPLMDKAQIDTVRLTSAYAGVSQLAILTGGSVAGVLIAVFNPWGAIWIDVASFIVCALIIIMLTEPPAKKPAGPRLEHVDGVYISASAQPQPADEPTESYLAQLKAAFTYLRQDNLIKSMVGMLFVTNMFAQMSTGSFIPIWVDSRLDHSPVALGWIGGAFALGGVAGNAVFTALATKLPRYGTFVAGYLIGGAPRILILAFSNNIAVVAVVWAISGFALSSANPTIGAVMYQRIPVHLLARVGSLVAALAFAGLSVGGVLGGIAIDKMGFNATVIFASVIYFCATLSPIFGFQTWRLIDKVTAPVRKFAAGAKVTIRLVLSEHQWTASGRRRDGGTIKRQPVEANHVAHALWLLNTPELQSTVHSMLAHERAGIRAREHALRSALLAAESRLVQVTGGASTSHQVTDATASIPDDYADPFDDPPPPDSPIPGGAGVPDDPALRGDPDLPDDAASPDVTADPDTTTSRAVGRLYVSAARAGGDLPAEESNGHHDSPIGETGEFTLTSAEDDIRRPS